MAVTETPTRVNYSFKVIRDLTLIYNIDNIDPAGMPGPSYQKLIPVDDILWYRSTGNGFIYFIDMDFEVGGFRGSRVGASYYELCDTGFLRLTESWITPPITNRRVPYMRITFDADGDALDRVKR
jgi:hypothetical protein